MPYITYRYVSYQKAELRLVCVWEKTIFLFLNAQELQSNWLRDDDSLFLSKPYFSKS